MPKKNSKGISRADIIEWLFRLMLIIAVCSAVNYTLDYYFN